MNRNLELVRVLGICLHVLTVGVLVGTVRQLMLAACLAVSSLIAPACWAAVRGRPVCLYIAFALVMGFCFWAGIGALYRQNWYLLILTFLLVVGSAVTLQFPGWPSLIFSSAAIFITLGISFLAVQEKPDYDDPQAQQAHKAVISVMIILSIGWVYSILGVVEHVLTKQQSRLAKKAKKTKAKKNKTRAQSEVTEAESHSE